MQKKVLWHELRRNEFQKAVESDAVVIIPVGSTEQHGEHLPVNTDVSNCFTIARRAAEAIDDFPVLVLPPVWTGYSPEHKDYPGVIRLKFHTFIELLTEIAVSVHSNGFRKIFFLNGHGCNGAAVSIMRKKLADEYGISSAVGYSYWEIPSVAGEMAGISETDKGWLGHAGEMETSMQLYLQPELVDRSAARWVPGLWGDPSTGTREKGERIVNTVVGALVKMLRDYHSGKLEDDLAWRKEIKSW